MRIAGLVLAALLCTAATAPETDLEAYFRLRQEGAAAARANDLATAEARFEAASALFPNAPGPLIMLARIETAAGKPDEAIERLRQYAGLGLTYDVATDPALAPLVSVPSFAPVIRALEANAAPVGHPHDVAVLTPAGAVFEGLVWTGRQWLVSSVAGRTIQKVDEGAPSPFLAPDPSTGGLFGMAVDRTGGVLWVAEADGPGIPGGQGERRTALLKIELSSGRILARYPVADTDKPRQLGDVVVLENGTVYASDGRGSALYRLPKEGKTLEKAADLRELASPQGMVACGSDSLLVVDYSSGLHRFDPATGRTVRVGGIPVALAGTDGLFAAGRTAGGERIVVATQNGVAPARVLALTLDADCGRVIKAQVMAAAHEGMDDLTLGAMAPGGVGVLVGSGWAGYDQVGKPRAGSNPLPGRLILLPRPGDAQ